MPETPKTFMEQDPARIDTICGGHIPEMFQREFECALRNVLDVNTPHKGKRVVTLKIELTTNETRDAVTVVATTGSKLQPFIGESGIVFAQVRGTEIQAVTYRADQMRLPFSEPHIVSNEPPRPEVAPGTARKAAQ